MSTQQQQETVRVGIGKYLLKTALFWGIISMIAAILLYIVSFNSLKEGLTATKAVTANSAALLAFAFNLIEIVALVWVFVDEFVGGDDKDTFVDLFVKAVLVFIVLGDVFAIFYNTGYTQSLPGDTFGNILTVSLRAIGAIIGGTGSETFILLGGMILWVWWLNYTGKTIEHHKPSAEVKPENKPAPADAKPAPADAKPAPATKPNPAAKASTLTPPANTLLKREDFDAITSDDEIDTQAFWSKQYSPKWLLIAAVAEGKNPVPIGFVPSEWVPEEFRPKAPPEPTYHPVGMSATTTKKATPPPPPADQKGRYDA